MSGTQKHVVVVGSGLPTIYESGRIAANLISREYGISFASANTKV